ncbi:MAG: Mov34/MPN/PAD-1 family protein [Chitinophagaceae bacterium]
MFREYKNKDGLCVLVPDKIFDDVKRYIVNHYPNECGGVFVGKIEGDTATIEKMMVPQRFRSTPLFFTRIADFINKWLVRVFKQSNGETIYLGEWHSHPNGRPYASTTDFNSMRKIAANTDVRIETPLLLIVGYNGSLFEERFYIYHNQKLIPYEKKEGTR